jgi:hypothetical protein
MGMKVCKLVRLTKKDEKGNFDATSKEGQIIVRKKAVVSEDSITETEDNCGTTGLLYIVDKAATAERNQLVELEIANSRKGDVENMEVVAEDAKSTKAVGDTKPQAPAIL